MHALSTTEITAQSYVNCTLYVFFFHDIDGKTNVIYFKWGFVAGGFVCTPNKYSADRDRLSSVSACAAVKRALPIVALRLYCAGVGVATICNGSHSTYSEGAEHK